MTTNATQNQPKPKPPVKPAPASKKCYCPDDCNCHHPWRPNYCGCRQHER